jgi:hypothetical protein
MPIAAINQLQIENKSELLPFFDRIETREEIPELPLSDFFLVTAFKDVVARLQLIPVGRRPPDWQLYVC